MSNDDVEDLIAREDAPPSASVEEVLDRQRNDAATVFGSESGPLDLVEPGRAEPALADLIDNTGDDGGAASG